MIAPELPAILTAHPAPVGTPALKAAVEGVTRGKLGATDLVWTVSTENCEFALVLEPEVSATAAAQMLLVLMLAIGDAIGSLASPKVGVTYSWPDVVRLNGARVGHARIAMDAAEHPEWLVIGADLRLSPVAANSEPGNTPDRTCLADEGCGEIHSKQLIAATARYLLRWLDDWQRDGFGGIRKQWLARLDAQSPLSGPHKNDWHDMDINGNALIGTPESLTTLLLLDHIRANHVA